ncbi:MAG: 30S ribosomal protein S16 [Actinomycetota bacterium]
MVKIRLMRVGKRKQPTYRVVVADARSPRDGRIIESIGHYAPRNEPSVIEIDTSRAVYWLGRGAQPSDPVRKLLQLSGAWSEFTGEAPAATLQEASPAATRKATPAASIKATPAASVSERGDEPEGDAAPAEVPEAVDQQAAAPDAEPTE